MMKLSWLALAIFFVGSFVCLADPAQAEGTLGVAVENPYSVVKIKAADGSFTIRKMSAEELTEYSNGKPIVTIGSDQLKDDLVEAQQELSEVTDKLAGLGEDADPALLASVQAEYEAAQEEVQYVTEGLEDAATREESLDDTTTEETIFELGEVGADDGLSVDAAKALAEVSSTN